MRNMTALLVRLKNNLYKGGESDHLRHKQNTRQYSVMTYLIGFGLDRPNTSPSLTLLHSCINATKWSLHYKHLPSKVLWTLCLIPYPLAHHMLTCLPL